MRVIAGTYRSRILKSLKGLALRPTSDRLRETLFNVLGSGISGSRFLDVFAGTGAVGIEALSRGAAHATFIENHAPGAALIRKNLACLKISSAANGDLRRRPERPHPHSEAPPTSTITFLSILPTPRPKTTRGS